MELEYLRRLYAECGPRLDPSGFRLYRAAEELTGVDLHSFYPYEDNRGMFEEVDGRRLLRYLLAAHFQAVEWEIVPGTTYERAVLREVDATTPGYRAFARKLYRTALTGMGCKENVKTAGARRPKRGGNVR